MPAFIAGSGAVTRHFPISPHVDASFYGLQVFCSVMLFQFVFISPLVFAALHMRHRSAILAAVAFCLAVPKSDG